MQQECGARSAGRKFGPEHPETVGAMNDLAIVLSRMGKFAEEQKILEEVVAVKRRTLGPEDPVTLRSVNNLGNRPGHARPARRRGGAREGNPGNPAPCRGSRVDHHAALGVQPGDHATPPRAVGRGSAAVRRVQLGTLRCVLGPDHQDTLRAVNGLGELLLDQRRPSEARALFEEALKGQRSVLGPKSDETVLTMYYLADSCALQGCLEEAPKLAEEADGLNRLTIGPEHPQTLFGLTILSSIARDQGQFDEARKGYEAALALLRRTLSARTPEVQRCMADYAWMLAAATDPGYRDPHRAIELANELIRNSPKVRDVWTTLGVAHYLAGAWYDAIAALEKSEAEAVASGRFLAVNGYFLAMAYWRLGEREKGREYYAKTLQSVEKASQPAGRRTVALSIGGLRLAGHLGPEAAREGRRLILNRVRSEADRNWSGRVSALAVGATHDTGPCGPGLPPTLHPAEILRLRDRHSGRVGDRRAQLPIVSRSWASPHHGASGPVAAKFSGLTVD